LSHTSPERLIEQSTPLSAISRWNCFEAGSADGHEVSILIGLGDGGRVGLAPANVSTMIIPPPQQGHLRAVEGVSVSLSASAGERSGATSDAPSNRRTWFDHAVAVGQRIIAS
jgi:hypothetical protein